MQKIVKRAQNNDKEAFAELMHAYKQDMYRVAKGYFNNDEDVADVIQETILACFEHLPELREPRFFKTWLIRILINKCKELKKTNHCYVVGMDNFPEQGLPDDGQTNAEFMMLMDSLDEQYRMVLILHYAEGLKVKQISEITGLTESAVKTRLKRGRKKARKMYETCGLGVLS